MTAINSRDIRLLTADGLRALVRVMNATHEDLNLGTPEAPLDAQAILDLHWAASDADYDGFGAWLEDLNSEGCRGHDNAAKRAWRAAAAGAKARAEGR